MESGVEDINSGSSFCKGWGKGENIFSEMSHNGEPSSCGDGSGKDYFSGDEYYRGIFINTPGYSWDNGMP